MLWIETSARACMGTLKGSLLDNMFMTILVHTSM